MLGHELRNPLSPILTALQLMKLRGEAGARNASAPIIERQVDAPRRASSRTSWTLARIARGRVELKTGRRRGGRSGREKAIEIASPLIEAAAGRR